MEIIKVAECEHLYLSLVNRFSVSKESKILMFTDITDLEVLNFSYKVNNDLIIDRLKTLPFSKYN